MAWYSRITNEVQRALISAFESDVIEIDLSPHISGGNGGQMMWCSRYYSYQVYPQRNDGTFRKASVGSCIRRTVITKQGQLKPWVLQERA